jgi:hypothetical protein
LAKFNKNCKKISFFFKKEALIFWRGASTKRSCGAKLSLEEKQCLLKTVETPQNLSLDLRQKAEFYFLKGACC